MPVWQGREGLMGQPHSFEEFSIGVLRQNGARLTKARLAVIRTLEQTDTPLSARDILENVREQEPDTKLDPVTAYRILDRFTSYGLVHQVAPSGHYLPCTHLRCQQQPHVLLHCCECGDVREEPIPTDLISSFFWYLRHELRFAAQKHVFQMDGLCRDCGEAQK